MVTSSEIDVRIDRKNVYRYLGYGTDGQPPARIAALIEEYAEEAHNLIAPSYSYAFRDIEGVFGSRAFVEGSGSLLSQTIVLESDVVARLLERCSRVAFMLVTVGNHLEETTCRLAEDGLVLQASVLDAIGSDAVERVMDFAQETVKDMAGIWGMVTSRRFSPGYCDWDITQQKALFRTVNADSVGVHLNERGLMMPQKSISGIVGVGHPESNVEDYNPCGTCTRLDCCGRR